MTRQHDVFRRDTDRVGNAHRVASRARAAPAPCSRRGTSGRCGSRLARRRASRRCSGTPGMPARHGPRPRAARSCSTSADCAARRRPAPGSTDGDPTTPFCTSCSTSAVCAGATSVGEVERHYVSLGMSSCSSVAISCAHSTNTAHRHRPDPARPRPARAAPRAAASQRAVPTAAPGLSARSRASRFNVAVRGAAAGWVRRIHSTCSRASAITRSAVSSSCGVACRLRWSGTGRPSDGDRVPRAPAHRHAFDHVRARRRDLQSGHVLPQDRSGHHRTRRVAGAQGDDVEIGHRPESKTAGGRRSTRQNAGPLGEEDRVPYTLVMLRHGQSTWNLENLFTGWVDVDLTELGPRRGACRAARTCAPPACCPTSCTPRCRCARSAPPSSRSRRAAGAGSRSGGRGA